MPLRRMSVAEEAHWSYHLERYDRWGLDQKREMVGLNFGAKVPAELTWLREKARYMMHLANAQARRAANR